MKVAIVGAGIAGLSVAQNLIKYGHQLTIIDSLEKLQGSSAPTILFHPFPGRSLETHPLLPMAVTEAVTLLQIWQNLNPYFVRNKTMLRPITQSNQSRLLKSYFKHWKNRDCSWATISLLNKDEFREREPFLLSSTNFPNAIHYSPAIEIDFRRLKTVILEHLQSHGVEYQQMEITSLQQTNGWRFNSLSARFDKVILAIGSNTPNWFPDLKITTQGGSLLKGGSKHPLNHLLSLNGLHIGSHNDNDWVIGSTRWNTVPEKEQEVIDLSNKLAALFSLSKPIHCSELWQGIRCIYPQDRLPLCGELNHYPGVYVITALGSKGMLWGPLAAKQLVLNLQHKKPISPQLSVQRATAMDGWYCPRIQTLSKPKEI